MSDLNQVFIANSGMVNLPGSGSLHDRVPAGRYECAMTPQGPKYRMVRHVASSAERLEYLPGSPAQVVVDDIRQFVNARSKFSKLGLGYKRGYLLYGPPGTGKSATLQMVIDEVVREHDAIVAHTSACEQGHIDLLRDLVGPDRLIVGIIEEVDEHCNSHTLSMLDGTRCTNVVFLATTNYLDDLPPRIRKRPGRFDRVVDVAEYPDESRVAYFQTRVGPTELGKYVKAAKDLPISAWREILVRVNMSGLTPAAAGKELRAWLKECEGDDDSEDL